MVEEGKFYVTNIKGGNKNSLALLLIRKIVNENFVNAYGFQEDGSWSNTIDTYDVRVCNFIEAEKIYVEQRFREHDTMLLNRALYLGSGSDVKYEVDGYYRNGRGKKIFRVIYDNKDLTYKIATLNINGEIVLKDVFFDKTAVLLTQSEITAYKTRKTKAIEKKRLDFYNQANAKS